jgi:hypothetical protein
MADSDSFAVGSAPWEQPGAADPHPDSFPKGKAPWETEQKKSSWLDTKLPGGTARGYIEGTLNALPTAGMVAGGIVGSPADIATGPMGTFAGAGIGAAAGTALKKAGERFILGKDESNAKVLGDTAMAVPEGMAYEAGGQYINKGLAAAAETAPAKYISEKAGNFAKWLANNASNVPKSDIEAYLKDPQKVMSLYKEAGGDEAEMADKVRGSINEKVQATKATLNNQISTTLKGRAGQTIDSKPIVEKLEASKAGINAKLEPEQIGEVDNLIKKVAAVTDENGKISLGDAHDLRKHLATQAESTYMKDGQMFARGDQSAQAAKGGAAATRSLLNEAAPEIAEANSKLHDLHEIEDVMNSNMLAKGKPSNSLYTAANGDNPTNAQALRRLDQAVGGGVMEDAKNLSAARTFGSPSLTPLDKTGKAAARMGATGILGAGIGYLAGGDEKSAIGGAFAAEGLTSPMAIKLAMDSGIGTKAIATKLAQQAPSVMGKGVAGWMNNGFSKLFQHASEDDRKALIDNQDALMNSKTGKNLLVSASSLKPGSKQMDKVLEQIKEEAK